MRYPWETTGDMPQSETLAHTLRDRLHLMGLKLGCGQGPAAAVR